MFVFFAFLAVSCSDSEKSVMVSSASYKTLDLKSSKSSISGKYRLTLKVGIKSKLSKEALHDLVLQIRDKDPNVGGRWSKGQIESLKIYFNIIDEELYWAIATFEPDLKLKIYGQSQEHGPLPEYNIISYEEQERPGAKHLEIKVELNKRASSADLRRLAKDLGKHHKNYFRTWIFYFLKGQDSSRGAWATSHFDPTLSVKIIGATKEEFQKIASTQTEGEVIGRWEKVGGLGGIYSFLKKNGKLTIVIKYPDGSNFESRLKKSGSTYRFDNPHGEYFKIEPNGNLGCYGKRGKFDEIKEIK